MAELNGYRCPNCNAMIPIPKHGNIYKCECCGSEFEKEQDYLKPLKVEVCHAKLVTLGYKTAIQDEYLKDKTIKEIAEHFGLTPYRMKTIIEDALPKLQKQFELAKLRDFGVERIKFS